MTRPPTGKLKWCIAKIGLACFIFVAALCRQGNGATACPPGNLLHGATPGAGAFILHPERLTDDTTVEEGFGWDNRQSAIVAREPLWFDLGEITRIRALLLQGDHPGSYTLSGSLDGAKWFVVWKTAPANGRGMRLRHIATLDRDTRFLRLDNPRSPSAYAISEIQAYCKQPETWPPKLEKRVGQFDPSLKADHWAYFANLSNHSLTVAILGLLVFLGLVASGPRRPSLVAAAGGLALCALALVYAFHRGVNETDALEQWLQIATVICAGAAPLLLLSADLYARRRATNPGGSRHGTLATLAAFISGAGAFIYSVAVAVLMRAQPPMSLALAVALVFAVTIALPSLSRSRRDWRKWSRHASLSAVAVASVYSFTNFGTFHDWRDLVRGEGRQAILNNINSWGAISYHDQFHYYLGAKYFRELGYDQLYRCVAVAELDNGRGDQIAKQRIRDLTTNSLRPGSVMLANPQACRNRFSFERWQAFRADVDYFKTRVDVPSAERYLVDHGYNATPLWTAFNRFIAGATGASDSTLRGLAFIDVGLLVGVFVLLWWAFSFEAAVLALLIWSTGRVWMYSSVGGIGSFGRFYSLFCMVAAVCCIKKQRFAIGGFALATAALLRVFPGALFFGPAIATSLELITKRRFDLRLVRIFAGAAIALTLLLPFSLMATNGIKSYVTFFQNSVKHTSTPLTNYMGLKTLFSFTPKGAASSILDRSGEDRNRRWKKARMETFAVRQMWFRLTVVVLIVFAALACWYIKEPWKLVIAGILPLFCIFDLTNYYYALLILLAPLAVGRLPHVLILLGMTLASQLLFRFTPDVVTYPADSLIVLAALLYFLGAEIFDARQQVAIAGQEGMQPHENASLTA